MPRITVGLTDYFDYLVQQGFIQEYVRADGIPSLELNIPAIWQQIFYPGEDTPENRRARSTMSTESLPTSIRYRLVNLGFHGTGERVGLGIRRYILIPHLRGITIQSYRNEILFHLSATSGSVFPNRSNHTRIIFNNYDNSLSGLNAYSLSNRFRSNAEGAQWIADFWDAFHNNRNPPR